MNKPVHPGLELAAKIKASGFKQTVLAAQLGIYPTHFNEILKGKRPVPAGLCVRMEATMGYGKQLWRKWCDYEWQLASTAASAAPASGEAQEGGGGL